MKKYIKPSVSENFLSQTICDTIDIPWISAWDEFAPNGNLPQMPTN